MNTTPTTPPEPGADVPFGPFQMLPDRTYRLSDILARRHPPPDELPPARPLPPPTPQIEFDRDTLTLTFPGREPFPLTAFETLDSPMPGSWPIDGELREAIYDAAWEVFNGHRFWRACLSDPPAAAGDDDPPPPQPALEEFDVWALAAAGYRLDWRAGVVNPPGAQRRSSRPVPLSELAADADGTAELVADRFLCAGGALLLSGPTGIGKSSLAMQLAVGWALNREVFGFKPTRPLASLMVQAENDEADLVEMRDGVAAGMHLDQADRATVGQMVSIATIDAATSHQFGQVLIERIRQWQPDIVFLDPLLAYVGGDVSKQEVASEFLRGILTPLMHRARVGVILLHHTGKPPREGQDERGTDYLGLGSSELSNWPRAIATLTRTKVDDVFALALGKRGRRANWFNGDGMRTFTRLLRHAEHGIHWEAIDETEAVKAAIAQAPSKDSLMAHVPVDKPILKDALISKAQTAGIGIVKAKGYIAELLDEGRLHEWAIARAKKKAAVAVARVPQPDQTKANL